jgi:hypothetical protein
VGVDSKKMVRKEKKKKKEINGTKRTAGHHFYTVSHFLNE